MTYKSLRNADKMIIILILCISGLFISIHLMNSTSNKTREEIINLSSEKSYSNVEWLKNSEFDNTDSWNLREYGDYSDLNGDITQGVANFYILGEQGEMKIDNALNDSDWTALNNPDLPILPDAYNITTAGAKVSHLWHENINQTRNRPSVQWKRTITMPVNMNDFVITSANLEVIFNATVTVSPWNTGGIDREGDLNLDDYSSGDFADFYVLISDLDETFEPITIASNRTSDLGQDSPAVSNYTDTPLNAIPEDVLISVLTTALENDNYTFVITIGIDIYCEDNETGVDQDRWDSLIMRSLNLTFTYEKKINQFTFAEYNQVANQIEGSNVQITKASLYFDHKINESWDALLSPSSEFRFRINDNFLEDSIKLSTLQTSLQPAKVGGYDVTSFLKPYENFTVAIQLYLADEFLLDHDINISIDNVFLIVSYKEIFEDLIPEPVVFLIILISAIVGAATIGGYLIAYQMVFKYPKSVRKVRKFRKTLKNQNDPRISVLDRKSNFESTYKKEISKSSRLLKVQKKKLIPEKSPKKPNLNSNNQSK
ncbi:MAG: hypothetical protein ACTSR7_16470 [Promethearchaeota archaeon]